MGEILEMESIYNFNHVRFNQELVAIIYDYQKKNLDVDIKYSIARDNCNTVYSALILGRKKPER